MTLKSKSLLTTLLSLGLLVSSSALAANETNLTCKADQRQITDFMGKKCVPIHPQRIASLRGEQFTVPLIELGAPIVASSGIYFNKSINGGKPYPRGAYDLFNVTFENSGLKFLGSPNDPDFEAIAAAKPDLILIPDWNVKWYDQLSKIAPTVAIDVWGQTFEQRYHQIADVVNKVDVFEKLQQRYQAKLERAKIIVNDRLGDPSKTYISFAQARTDGKIHVYRIYSSLSKVVNDLGFSRPALQNSISGPKGFTAVSPEQLPAVDADFIIGTYSLSLNQTPTTIENDWEKAVPGWRDHLFAHQNNQYIFIDREQMRSLSFRAAEDVLQIILTNVAGRGFKHNPNTITE